MGRHGEEIAAAWLAERGMEIIDRNCRSRLGEIDLIGRQDGLLVFVEVRSRSTAALGRPAESVNWRKRRKLRLLASAYLTETGQWDQPCRFDVVGILLSGDGAVRELEWIQNAF
jgi:putative endonuclease